MSCCNPPCRFSVDLRENAPDEISSPNILHFGSKWEIETTVKCFQLFYFFFFLFFDFYLVFGIRNYFFSVSEKRERKPMCRLSSVFFAFELLRSADRPSSFFRRRRVAVRSRLRDKNRPRGLSISADDRDEIRSRSGSSVSMSFSSAWSQGREEVQWVERREFCFVW